MPALGADIWDFLKKGDAKSILDVAPAARKHTHHLARFSCEDLAKALFEIHSDVEAGRRDRPTRDSLRALLGARFGVGTDAVKLAVRERCPETRWLSDRISYVGRVGFTKEEQVRIGATKKPFSCEELKEVLTSSTRKRTRDVAKALSERLGKKVTEKSVYNALSQRCQELRPLWDTTGAGRMEPSFSCEQLEAALKKHGRERGYVKKVAAELNIAESTLHSAMKLTGRCGHLHRTGLGSLSVCAAPRYPRWIRGGR